MELIHCLTSVCHYQNHTSCKYSSVFEIVAKADFDGNYFFCIPLLVLPDVNTTNVIGAVVGQSAQLNCTAQGGVINQFQWFDSDGILINSTGRFNITELDNEVEDVSMLTIYPVIPTDQGVYTCEVTTDRVTLNSTILLVGELSRESL